MASSYGRRCKYCQRWISMRQMPAGQWVAFENDKPHDCNAPGPQVRKAPRVAKPGSIGLWPPKD
jgi:hypothetical protein